MEIDNKKGSEVLQTIFSSLNLIGFNPKAEQVMFIMAIHEKAKVDGLQLTIEEITRIHSEVKEALPTRSITVKELRHKLESEQKD